MVINYVEGSLYGLQNGLIGFDGVIRFFEARKRAELNVFQKLPIDKAMVNNPEYKWDEVFNQVLRELNS